MNEAPYESVARVTGTSAWAAARSLIYGTDERTVDEMKVVTSIEAPTGAEARRGEWVAERLRELGLEPVVDDVGNVVVRTPAADPGAPDIVVAAHLDTVFAAGTDLSIREEGVRISAPGISDNGRGLAALLAVARALHAAGWPTRAPVVLVATVGEEGIGDLRGAKHYMEQHGQRTAAFIALDGAGASRIIHAGVGSRRMRATFRARGGHSWADWGAPNAIHAAGRAIAALAAVEVPADPRTTLTVARMGGGTSINAIPSEAWVELDLRSEKRGALLELETIVLDTLQRAAAAESSPEEAVTCEVRVFGDRPAGVTPPRHPLVLLAEDATRHVGLDPELTSSSTDANVAMAAEVPALAIGAGGSAGGMHTTQEWYENEEGPLGIERALLIILAAAGVAAA
jgi:tripeptide aminopeptidase